MKTATEIVINATRISDEAENTFYEFILDQEVSLKGCGVINSLSRMNLQRLPETQLLGELFELNHVRVDPDVDNTFILRRLMIELETCGIGLQHSQQAVGSHVVTHPIPALSDSVRFYLKDINGDGHNELVFLSKSVQLKVL